MLYQWNKNLTITNNWVEFPIHKFFKMFPKTAGLDVSSVSLSIQQSILWLFICIINQYKHSPLCDHLSQLLDAVALLEGSTCWDWLAGKQISRLKCKSLVAFSMHLNEIQDQSSEDLHQHIKQGHRACHDAHLDHLLSFGICWEIFELLGTIRDHLGSFRTIWDHLRTYKTIWDNLGQFETILDH